MTKRLLLPALIISLLAMTTFADGKSDSNRKKADYLYLEALRQNALENTSAYFHLMEQAWMLDTTQTYLGSELGYLYIVNGLADRGYSLMKRHFDAHPEDYYSTMLIAKLAYRFGDTNTSLKAWSTLDSISPNRPEIVLQYADAIAHLGDRANIRKAIALIDSLESYIGLDVTLTDHKCGYLSMLGDTAAVTEIINEGRRLVKYSPQSSTAHLYLSHIFQNTGDNDSVRHYIDKAVELDGENGMALAARADYFRQIGDSAAYDRDVFNVLANTNMDVETKTEMLRDYVSALYQDTLQKPRILEMFNLMIERHPIEASLRNLYGSYLSTINDYNGAAEQFGYSSDLTPNDSVLAFSVCQLYLMGDSPQKALEYARGVQERFPESHEAVAMEGYAAYNLEDKELAINAFTRAIDMTPADSDASSDYNSVIGDIIISQGDTIKGLQYYDKALEINPENSSTLNNYAYMLALMGVDLDKAEQMSYKAIIQKPSSATDLDTYAWIMFCKKDFKKAKEYIDRALSFLEEDSPEIYEHAGDIYFFNGQRDKAIEFWQRASELKPDDKLLIKKLNHKTYFED